MDIDNPLYSTYFLEQLSRAVISSIVIYPFSVLSFFVTDRTKIMECTETYEGVSVLRT